MYSDAHILTLADNYVASTGAALSSVSLYCSGSGGTFRRLKAGGSLTIQKAARILQWFSDQWPVGVPWPADVPRPGPAPDSPFVTALLGEQGQPDERAQASVRALTALDANGHIADVDGFLEALNEGRLYVVLRPTYDSVVREYADGRLRAQRWPRQGTKARRVLDALVAGGDRRFAERAALMQRIFGDVA